MMNSIVKKLRSESGATLMLALLMFIMCAVAGSIILAAGTATAGRKANGASGTQGKADQDYYTMSSAVRVVRDQFEGGMVFVMGTAAESDTKDTYADSDFTWKYLSAQKDDTGEKYLIGSTKYDNESDIWKLSAFDTTSTCELEKFVTGEKTDSKATYYLALNSPNPDGVDVYTAKCDVSMDTSTYSIRVEMTLCDNSGTAVKTISGENEVLIFPASIREYDDEVKKAGGKDFSGSTLTEDTRIRRRLISWGEGTPE